MNETAKLSNISIVLQKPKYAGNIGAVARAAKNMGINKIIVISQDKYEQEEVKTRSTHLAVDVVEKIKYADDIKAALGRFNYIVGTTARKGAARGPFLTPRQMAEKIISLSQNNKIALLFGPEDKGLSNDELRFCHAAVTIPTARAFRSLNLSHAVMVLCYEIFIASLERMVETPPKLARAEELEGMYEQLKTLLAKVGFLNPQNPDYWMMHLRKFFSRTTLLARDVKIIRGVCRQIDWYTSQKKT
ncbi:MAG TPA: RNA methyltransferase [Smithellaceae bacterium]|nr:RNA methyltransferase [Smithellaceae bacterium]HRS90129.1 RNA methyltransferase [Smithellaceae bacterium]HRV26978.1 RNA methyltransferase [Smithellaceae bacterium]